MLNAACHWAQQTPPQSLGIEPIWRAPQWVHNKTHREQTIFGTFAANPKGKGAYASLAAYDCPWQGDFWVVSQDGSHGYQPVRAPAQRLGCVVTASQVSWCPSQVTTHVPHDMCCYMLASTEDPGCDVWGRGRLNWQQPLATSSSPSICSESPEELGRGSLHKGHTLLTKQVIVSEFWVMLTIAYHHHDLCLKTETDKR